MCRYCQHFTHLCYNCVLSLNFLQIILAQANNLAKNGHLSFITLTPANGIECLFWWNTKLLSVATGRYVLHVSLWHWWCCDLIISAYCAMGKFTEHIVNWEGLYFCIKHGQHGLALWTKRTAAEIYSSSECSHNEMSACTVLSPPTTAKW